MKKKVVISFLLSVFVFVLMAPMANAQEYEELYEASGIEELADALPEDTKEIMEQAGFASPDAQSLLHFDLGSVYDSIISVAQEQGTGPMKAGMLCFGVILLASFFGGMGSTIEDSKNDKALNIVISVCLSVSLLTPLLAYFSTAAESFRNADIFEKSFVPVFIGLLIASGQPLTASGSAAAILTVSEVSASLLCDTVLPLIKIIASVSAVGNIAQEIKIDGLIKSAVSTIKWLLGIMASVTVAALTLSGIVSSAADTVSGKAAKFVVSSAVPVIGGAVSDALTSVKSCITLLKTSAGAYGIIAAAYIFLPVLLQGVMWSIVLSLCASAADLLGAETPSRLLRSFSGAVSLVISSCVLFMLTLIISQAIIILTGKSVF